jgi:hypothetical protein
MKPRILDGRSRRAGDEFCGKRQRVLKEKRVSDFGRDRDRKVSNRARLVAWVLVRRLGVAGRCGWGCLLRECNRVGRVLLGWGRSRAGEMLCRELTF